MIFTTVKELCLEFAIIKQEARLFRNRLARFVWVICFCLSGNILAPMFLPPSKTFLGVIKLE